jgi:8-amino-7-oxononanoate synthase
MEDRGFDLESRLDALEENDLKRALAPVDRVAERGYFAAPSGGDLPVLESDEALVFASNNYLGLTANQRVQDAARQAAATVGTGAGASRLAAGDTLVHRDLERVLAETTHADRALAFPSRTAAVVGTLTALEPDVVFADEQVHRTVTDGCQLAAVECVTYDHCDPTSLRSKLRARTERDDAETESWLVVTNSVFNVDGAVAPLTAICDAAEAFGAWMLVDETHATGLYADGGGVVQAEGLADRIQIQLGTLSTALASQGGYVAGSDALIEWLINEARTFTDASGLAPTSAAAASEAIHLARHSDARERLWDNVAHLRDGLEAMGFEILGDSQILPVLVDERRNAQDLAAGLRDRDVVVSAIQPPTVPDGTCRLRVTPLAAHDESDIVACLEAFRAAGAEIGLL